MTDIGSSRAPGPTSTATITGPSATAPERRPKRPSRPQHRPAWQEKPSLPGRIGKIAALTAITLVVLYPMYTVMLTSISTQGSVNESGGMVTVPRGITFGAYEQILTGGVVTQSILVSVFITGVGTLLATGVSIMAAYGLSRPGSLFHRGLLLFFVITMFFGAGMIPTYLLVSNLGLIDSLWSLILPSAVSAFNLLILRNFFMGIDRSITEAARIDGASDWRILRSIVIPMSKAVIAVIALFYGVMYWNSFFNAMLYLNDSSKWPLQLVLRSYVLQGQPVPGADVVDTGGAEVAGLPIKMAITVVAVIPILLVYPLIQRHFTKGVIFGAIKG
ncbi:MAG: carbohydrate ABC transporter permease [Brachybacterium sp.]|uniref:carbohydrate ABC transporter permease n=1 Tax=Brachybacterium sp. TaxID=1891286 RepID=UPI003F924F10